MYVIAPLHPRSMLTVKCRPCITCLLAPILPLRRHHQRKSMVLRSHQCVTLAATATSSRPYLNAPAAANVRASLMTRHGTLRLVAGDEAARAFPWEAQLASARVRLRLNTFAGPTDPRVLVCVAPSSTTVLVKVVQRNRRMTRNSILRSMILCRVTRKASKDSRTCERAATAGIQSGAAQA